MCRPRTYLVPSPALSLAGSYPAALADVRMGNVCFSELSQEDSLRIENSRRLATDFNLPRTLSFQSGSAQSMSASPSHSPT